MAFSRVSCYVLFRCRFEAVDDAFAVGRVVQPAVRRGGCGAGSREEQMLPDHLTILAGVQGRPMLFRVPIPEAVAVH